MTSGDTTTRGAALHLTPGALDLAALERFWRAPGPVTLDPAAWPGVNAAAETVARIVKAGERVYGINTGFGKLANTAIDASQVGELQRRLVLSHCAGVGPALSHRVVRLTLLLKVNALARGHSGARRQVIDALLEMLNADLLPVIPAQGSVGASGDLAPLAHLSAVLIGEGEVWDGETRIAASDALHRLGLAPFELAAKEGLALLNGTQVSTALALDALFAGLDLYAAAVASGAMSVDAALGSDVPFDPRINALRGQPGQSLVADAFRRLLADSEIRASHLDCDRVQDPYSLRCQPQVMGAALDLLDHAARTLVREANAVTDNPLVFPDDGEILSGGNFHAEPVAFAADTMAIALCEIGALAERRVALLTDANMSSLPPFLVAEPGLNSGFMIAHVTAAALASENKILAHPASVDSLPTSANQEDHVSMSTHGARRLAPILANAGRIVAIELLAAAQGLDLRKPLKSSPLLQGMVAKLRDDVAFRDDDRDVSGDIEHAYRLVASGWLSDQVWGGADRIPIIHQPL